MVGLKFRSLICLLLTAVLVGCGAPVATATSPSSQRTASTTTAIATPTTTPSPHSCSGEAATPRASPGWITYSSLAWCFALDYPASWYDLPNLGAPHTDKYFSNEDVGGPLYLTAAGIFLVVSITHGDCPAAWMKNYRIDGESTLIVAGTPVRRTYGFLAPPQSESGWIIHAAVARSSNCYTIEFITLSRSARDSNLATADRIITSFRFD